MQSKTDSENRVFSQKSCIFTQDMEKRVTFDRTQRVCFTWHLISFRKGEILRLFLRIIGTTTLFPVIIEQVLISAYLIEKSRIYTEYMENKMIFERYQHLFDYHGKRSTQIYHLSPQMKFGH